MARSESSVKRPQKITNLWIRWSRSIFYSVQRSNFDSPQLYPQFRGGSIGHHSPHWIWMASGHSTAVLRRWWPWLKKNIAFNVDRLCFFWILSSVSPRNDDPLSSRSSLLEWSRSKKYTEDEDRTRNPHLYHCTAGLGKWCATIAPLRLAWQVPLSM